jgi:NhaP-type Na+/H+ or K+/H+ antiporter
VLALIAALRVGDDDFNWWHFVLQDLSVGLVTGAVVGFLAARLMPRSRAVGAEISPHQKALYALGVAFLAYGAAVLPPAGNGLISVFVCAIVLGIQRPDIRTCFEARSEDIIEVVKLGIFVVFGALLTVDGLFGDGLAGLGIAAFTLLVARPAAVFLSLAGTRVDTATKAFMSWFGPKGVATMTFALLVLSDTVAAREEIFNIAALAVLVSIVAHGVTDHAGANWIAARSAAPERAEAPG